MQLDVSGQQEPELLLDVSTPQRPALHLDVSGQQESELHLDVSTLQRLVLHPDVPSLQLGPAYAFLKCRYRFIDYQYQITVFYTNRTIDYRTLEFSKLSINRY